VPIWRQIEQGVRRLVAAGGYPRGGAVPSVRDLARKLRVNPATVAKAYQRLADAGVLVVRRGEGTFVSDQPPPMSRTERDAVLGEAAGRYASVALTVGATRDEAADRLHRTWDRLAAEPEGGGER
jgi:GntR family transcriptional regulator